MTGPTTPSPSERPAAALGRGGRMSRRRKLGAVPRPLRGEDLELVSCELGVTAARLTAWRNAFLAAGERDDRPQRRPGPTGGHTDDGLAAAIRRALADGPFTARATAGSAPGRASRASGRPSGACREGSPPFVREPEGNGCAGRLVRTLKEKLLCVRRFATVDEPCRVLLGFRRCHHET